MTESAGRPARVLVGVDGSPSSMAALEFAVTEARLRHAALVAVMAVDVPDRAWIDPYAIRGDTESTVVAKAQDKLRSILGRVDTDGVDVELVVTTSPAPSALIGHSADCALLVVGSRGHGGFRGLLLGSVSMQCVLHADCPVTVVRPAPAPATPAEHHTLEDVRRQTTAPFM